VAFLLPGRLLFDRRFVGALGAEFDRRTGKDGGEQAQSSKTKNGIYHNQSKQKVSWSKNRGLLLSEPA
jgi:hypothetical protein